MSDSSFVTRAHHGRLEELNESWSALFDLDTDATPFASPAWALSWWRHYGERLRPWVITVRRSDGSLVGLAPLVLARRGPIRVLRGLGLGIGNYWDVIARQEDRAEVRRSVGSHLVAESHQWDLLHVDRFPPASATPTALLDAGLRVRRRPGVRAPWIDLPSTFDEYLSNVSSNRRSKLRRYLRPIERGELTIRLVDDPAQLRAVVEQWQQLRVAWWRARGRPINPDHASDRFRAFTADVLESLVPQNLASVRLFTSESRTAGISIDFVDRRTMYYWLGGYDAELVKLRLGHAAITSGIRDAIDRGLTGYDFMVGTESYKYDYGAQDRELPGVLVGSRRARSRVAAIAAAARDRVRRPGVDHD